MKFRILYCFILFFPFSVFSQTTTVQNRAKSHNIFTLKDGLKIDQISKMSFDQDGWLWLTGSSTNKKNNVISVKKPIIQRFNGTHFYDVVLPGIIEEDTYVEDLNIDLISRQDGLFYLLLNSKIYLIDPFTLESKLVFQPSNEDIKDRMNVRMYPFKDYFLIFSWVDKKHTFIYKIYSDQKVEFIKETDELKDLSISKFLQFENFLLISDERAGVLTLDTNLNVKHKLQPEEIGQKANDVDYVISIKFALQDQDKTYVIFSTNDDVFEFDSQNMTFTRNSNPQVEKFLKDKKSAFSYIYPSNSYGINYLDYISNKSTYAVRDLEHSFEYNDPVTENLQLWSSLNKKQLYIFSNKELHQLNYNESSIATYLEDYSIRTIYEMDSFQYLVATEFNGWFTINIETNEVEPYVLRLKGEHRNAGYTRGIFSCEKGYWSNYDKGIIRIDTNSMSFEPYVYYPVSAMFNDSTNIYYGTHRFNLMRFDKKTGKNHILYNTEELSIIDIEKIGNDIFLATDLGFYLFDGVDLCEQVIQSKENAQSILSMEYDKNQGLFGGSTTGGVYKYDFSNMEWQLFYQDPTFSSIASMLFDDNQSMWINTFSGIISYNLLSGEEKRYSELDGLSHNECNRYSALKTRNGNFVIGTLKGVNFFDPKSIKKVKKEGELQIVSLEYFEQDLAEVVSRYDFREKPHYQSLTLPFNHRNLKINYWLKNYSLDENIHFQYRFNDEEWIDQEQNTQLNLINIIPGNFTLEINAIGFDGNQIGSSIIFDLYVEKIFYKRWWFIMLILTLTGSLTYLYIRMLRNREKLQQAFSNQILNSQEVERAKISRDIHDSVGQKLMLISRKTKELNDPDLVNLTKETIEELRYIYKGLHPHNLTNLGLTVALKSLIDEVDAKTKILFEHDIDNIDSLFDQEKSVHIYRIMQEVLNNIIKHSRATNVQIRLANEDGKFFGVIEDNGDGFELKDDGKSKHGMGMQTMRERAKLIGIQFEIHSKPTHGTKIWLNSK